MTLSKMGKAFPFSGIFRKLEQDMETVVRVLKPGHVGIIEHKFTNEEIREADAVVRRAVENWKKRTLLDKNSVLKDFIDM